MDFFKHVELKAPDPILGLTTAYKNDPRSDKINLGVGVYYDADLQQKTMNVVHKAEELLCKREPSKTYLSIDGDSRYLDGLQELIFGENLEGIVSAQSVGGTGAIRVGLDLLKEVSNGTVHIPNPSWPNHLKVAKAAGLKTESYPYYNNETHRVDFEKTFAYFSSLPKGSVVILHGCCHNPTGTDFSMEQWEKLSVLFLEKGLFPFFDLAYLGFGDGLDRDRAPIRLFAKAGHNMAVAASCSKNFGLYGERTGALYVLTSSKEEAMNVLSNVKQLIRSNYSNPPCHGAKLVGMILQDPTLRAEWEAELDQMRARITGMRQQFTAELTKRIPGRDFSFLNESRGLFSYTGLTKEQVHKVREESGIYMTDSGRINICGLNKQNVERVADAIAKVVQ
ncbi:MAG: amino acid aminotransferase [Candidatus Algichlamydia australiensis]|nr:amino acid aminotransferase [Chlamydiales bacterium]